MYDHLFIAEKLNLAKDIAEARSAQLGQPVRTENGVMMVGNDAFTNVSGHFYDNAPLDHYDPALKSWSFSTLPFLRDLKRVADEKRLGQLENIRRLTANSKRIVNVGDAAREGQLIVDEVLEEFGLDPHGDNVLRLWLSDMTKSKVVEALKAMKPNGHYRNLYESAVARQWADFYLGINGTRAYTIKAREAGGEGVVSIGRVQTPTVRLVVDRDLEIENFKPVDHYGATGLFEHANGTFSAKWVIPKTHPDVDMEGRLLDRKVVEAVQAKVAGKKGKVSSVDTTGKSQTPPLPFDLAGLQKECGKLGLGIERTLEIAQELYDKYKVTSYPRTDFTHLPTELREKEAPTIIGNLKEVAAFAEMAGRANLALKSPAWNDSKVEDHYGLVPTMGATKRAIESLPGEVRQVFDIIAKRFIAQFHPDHRWDATVVNVVVEGEAFKANGRVVTQVGWKAVYGATAEEDEDEVKRVEKEGADQTLPKMAKGDDVLAKSAKVDAIKTKPPAHFTDVTLLEAMKKIHLFVTDPEVKKKLKETSGLGKSSTRTAIIKLIEKRNYVTVDSKKKVKSTTLARNLIKVVDAKVSDPGTTAVWEDALDDIASGKMTRDGFLTDLRKTVTDLVAAIRASEIKIAAPVKPLPGHGKECSKCGKGKMFTRTIRTKKSPKGEQVLACSAYSREPGGCSNIEFKRDFAALPGEGNPCPSCKVGKLITRGYKPAGAKAVQTFLACDQRVKDKPGSCQYIQRSETPPLPDTGKPCPTCKEGKLVTRMVGKDGPNKGRRFYSCSAYDFATKKGCDHFEFGEPPKGGAATGRAGASTGRSGGQRAAAGGRR